MKVSLVGLIMLFITGSSFYMIFKFPYYMRLKVIFVFLFVVNTLLFVRFRDQRKSLINRMMQSSFFPRKLTFTMEGKFLVFITLGIGFAAVNTGVNLLYLLMAMLLSRSNPNVYEKSHHLAITCTNRLRNSHTYGVTLSLTNRNELW